MNLYTVWHCSTREKHIVTVDGKPCHLTVKEFELLRYLLVNTDIVPGENYLKPSKFHV